MMSSGFSLDNPGVTEADHVRKEIITNYSTLGLNTTMSCNLKSVIFLDLKGKLHSKIISSNLKDFSVE